MEESDLFKIKDDDNNDDDDDDDDDDEDDDDDDDDDDDEDDDDDDDDDEDYDDDGDVDDDDDDDFSFVCSHSPIRQTFIPKPLIPLDYNPLTIVSHKRSSAYLFRTSELRTHMPVG